MTYTIAEPCIDVKDRGCVDECPVDCIYEGPRMLYIHPDECVDCGACEPVCPVTAIFYEDDVPAEWKQFTPINAEWFNDDISGVGQTRAALDLAAKLPESRKQYLLAKGVGHYGIFNGRKWREQIAPVVEKFISANA